ncbi:MAG TPA: class I SAM-dependent methyltransferase, partial [Bacteroidota bacterium]|nr:class I SAM-dependent methyltransferase [Bacteroidota bacterium]
MEQLIEEKQQPVTLVTEPPAAPTAPDPCDPVRSLEQYHRYLYASRFVRNKRVLEIGCGEGYGTAFLSLNAADVLGIDPDESAISGARCKYQEFTHSRFEVGIPGENIACSADRDVAICFGTLEHLPMEKRHAMMKNLKTAMAPAGVAIITTAVRTVASAFNGNGTDLFTPVEFAEFTKEYFKNVLFVGQKPLTVSSIWSLYQWKDDSFRFHARENLFTLPPDDEQFSEPDQLIAICSDENLPREIADSSKSLYFDVAQHARVEELPARAKTL